jgi:hypothetical protein
VFPSTIVSAKTLFDERRAKPLGWITQISKDNFFSGVTITRKSIMGSLMNPLYTYESEMDTPLGILSVWKQSFSGLHWGSITEEQ